MSMPPPPPFGEQPQPPQPYGQPGYGQPGYGQPPPGYAPYGQPGQPQGGNSGMAIAGFVLSLVALIPCFWFWMLQVPGYLGVIFSTIGLKATRDNARKGRGLAMAGLIIGIVAVLLAVAVTAFIYTSEDCVVDGLNVTCDFD